MPVSIRPSSHSLSPSKPPLPLTNQGDDGGKLLSRLVSKESSSVANSSFRVYYAGVAGAVPFVWESQPGTPKHALFASDSFSDLPPLTPPPSSFRRTPTSNTKQPAKSTVRISSSFLHWILGKIKVKRLRSSPAVALSASSSVPAGLGFFPVKPILDYRGRRSRFLSQGSFDSINPIDDGVEETNMAGPQQPEGWCFAISRRMRS
ncbi:hypothetical protein SAY86_007884 [Trapa natans]|uniref:Uncharacterized protein n=1 Tax=Trapa natans TaxID=22666 RepID=A0AAN7LE61_TRANT|nr:hypothetical protein SAY86_007884 [Trapa natans]